VVVGAEPDDRVELFFNSVDDQPEHYVPRLMGAIDDTEARPGELYEGYIPGQPEGATVRYYIAITRDGNVVARDPDPGDLRPFVFRIAP
jgi:hypothetical protein